jgi:hypothetical protein
MAPTNTNPALATRGSAEISLQNDPANSIIAYHNASHTPELAQASIAAVFSEGRCIGHIVSRGKTGIEAFDTDDLSAGVFPTEKAAVAQLWRSRWVHPADAVKRVINAAAGGTNTITEEAGSKEATMPDLLDDVQRPVQWISHARELLAACAVEIKNLREVNAAYRDRVTDLQAQIAAMRKPLRQARKTKARTTTTAATEPEEETRP